MFTKSKTVFVKGFLLATISSLLVVQGVYAQSSRAARKDEKEQSGPQFDQKTGEILQAAIEMLNGDKYADARTKLGELNLDKLSPNERATVEKMFFQIELGDEKYDSARAHMQKAIDSGGLNDQEISEARYFMAQLYFQEQKWKEGVAGIEEWLKTATNPNGNVYYLLASGYYNMEQMGPAVTNIKKAIDLTPTPKEEWLVLYASLLNQTEKFQEGIPVAKRLIGMNAKKKDYWMLLASFYGQLDDSKNALVVMQAANYAGLLTQSAEIKNLASYMQIEGMPYNAAQLIEKSIEAKTLENNAENLESLANAWVGAAEYKKAVSVYERISNNSSNGNTLHRIGELNMQVEDWPAASEAFEKALNKGGLKDTADTQYWLAIALYSQGKLRESKPWFERSANGKNGKNARAFVNLIDSKLQ